VDVLLRLSQAIDWINNRLAKVANILILLSCLVSAGNASMRYAFSMSSNAWLEIQWYMFAGIVMLGTSYTLKVNEHVRVDLFYGMASPRARLWIDTVGLSLFLLPATALFAYLSWPLFKLSWDLQELSSNAGGLIRWPVKLVIPAGFALLTLQGISELIKRVAMLVGAYDLDTRYERPVQ
jgi:TRAP-type mannitol/chloroaromatic compound transport system permease small subunit